MKCICEHINCPHVSLDYLDNDGSIKRCSLVYNQWGFKFYLTALVLGSNGGTPEYVDVVNKYFTEQRLSPYKTKLLEFCPNANKLQLLIKMSKI